MSLQSKRQIREIIKRAAKSTSDKAKKRRETIKYGNVVKEKDTANKDRQTYAPGCFDCI